MNAPTKTLVVAASVAGAGALSWVGFRMYVRQRLSEVLADEYDYTGAVAKIQGIASLADINLNLPPQSALVESMVPIWSTILPEEAFADIVANGRASAYWPADYKASPNPLIEGIVWDAVEVLSTSEGSPGQKLNAVAASLYANIVANLKVV